MVALSFLPAVVVPDADGPADGEGEGEGLGIAGITIDKKSLNCGSNFWASSAEGKSMAIRVCGIFPRTGQAATIINRATPGSSIFFDQIKVKGPDGVRDIPAVIFQLK